MFALEVEGTLVSEASPVGLERLSTQDLIGVSQALQLVTPCMGLVIGTLRGVGGRGVGDYISLFKAPYPPKGPYDLDLKVLPTPSELTIPLSRAASGITWCKQYS